MTLLAPGRALAQSCQALSGLPYGSYTDTQGQPHDLLLDLLLPQGISAPAPPLPAVIWVHGGGWWSGSRLDLPDAVSALCGRGYAVAAIDYRLSIVAPWPAQIQDVRGAVRWLRAHAAEYGLDPDRFGAWGMSAGGHLAALLGTAGGVATGGAGGEAVDLEGATGGNPGLSSRVQAAVDWYGESDFLRMRFYPGTEHDASSSPESRLLGAPIQTVPARAATADPCTYATADDPPFLVMHGGNDQLVPFNQSELLVDALHRAGVPVTFSPLSSAGHGGSAFDQPAVRQAAYDFLDAVLGPRGLPAVRIAATDAVAGEAGAGAGASAADSGELTVTRTGDLSRPLLVRWTLAGTAARAADYTVPGLPLTIPAGTATARLALLPLDDDLVEGEESAVVTLLPDPAYRIAAGKESAAVSIADDEDEAGLPAVSVAATDASASEVGPDGGRFTVSRTGDLSRELAVAYRVAGTATPGADYTGLPGTVVLAAGQAAAQVAVAPANDAAVEPAETVILELLPDAGYGLGAARIATVVLAESDLDPARPVVSLSAVDPAAAEPGTDLGSFLVTRTGDTASSLVLDLLLSGTAANGTDYSRIATATIPAGANRLLVNLRPVDDKLAEGPETAVATVATAATVAGILPGPYRPVVTLADDESRAGFYPLPPCRAVDTRRAAAPLGGPALLCDGTARGFELAGVCGIPADAAAVVLNVTVVNPSGGGHLTLFGASAPQPETSTVNFEAGRTRANNTVLGVLGDPAALGAVCAGGARLDLLVDVSGYFR